MIAYIDRTGLEVFAGDGLTYVPLPINLDPRETAFEAGVAGGPDPARRPRSSRAASHLAHGWRPMKGSRCAVSRVVPETSRF